MNKNLIRAGVMILGCLLYVKTADTASQTGEWKSEKVKHQIFSKLYHADACSVFTRKDKLGVMVIAWDHNYHGHKLLQVIQILKSKNEKLNFKDEKLKNKVAFTDRLYLVTKKDGPYSDSLKVRQVSQNYDIFSVKYLEAARKLPPKVRELFFDYYGLK